MTLYLFISLGLLGFDFGSYSTLQAVCDESSKTSGKTLILKVSQEAGRCQCPDPNSVHVSGSLTNIPAQGELTQLNSAGIGENTLGYFGSDNSCEVVEKIFEVKRIRCKRYQPPELWSEVTL